MFLSFFFLKASRAVYIDNQNLQHLPRKNVVKDEARFHRVLFFPSGRPKSFVLPHCQLSLDTSVHSDSPFALPNRGDVQYLTSLCLADHFLLRFQCSLHSQTRFFFPSLHSLMSFLTNICGQMRRRKKSSAHL